MKFTVLKTNHVSVTSCENTRRYCLTIIKGGNELLWHNVVTLPDFGLHGVRMTGFSFCLGRCRCTSADE